MSQAINPDLAFVDNSTGQAVALGTSYWGEPYQDPETDPKAPYSDSALTTAVSATQPLSSAGKPEQSLYLSGAYSLRVRDSAGNIIIDEEYIVGLGGSVSDVIHLPKLFGAVGDGLADDTEPLTSLIAHAIENGGVAFITGGNFKTTSPIPVTGPVTIIGDGIAEIHYYDTGSRITNNAFVGPAIFQYIDTVYPNGGIDGVTIRNLICRGKVSASVDHYVFCSLGYNSGSLITGQTTARVDNFEMSGCRVYDMCAHMCYGSNFKSFNNVAINTLGTSVDLDRHYAFAFNHFLFESDDTYDDLVESDCEIHHNSATMYGGAVLVHSYFNLSDNTRLSIKNAEVHNIKCFGGDQDATIISRAPVYCASVKRVRVHDCFLYYGEDVGIDFENCPDARAHHNHLENCNLAQFWDADRTVFDNNTVLINDQDWYDDSGIFARVQFVRKSGSQCNGLLEVRKNKFLCTLSGADRLGKIANSVAVARLEIEDNEFLNAWIDAGYDIPRVDTKINDNIFRYDKVITNDGVSPIDLDAMGFVEICGNEFQNYTVSSDTITRIAQTSAFAAIHLRMNRYVGTQDARKAFVCGNRGIYGWPNSFEFVDAGSSTQRWTIEFCNNEYDGYLIAETPSTTQSRAFIRDNFRIADVDDGTAGKYSAFPSNPTEAADVGGTTGTHDGSSGAAVLTDSGESWTTNAFVGLTIINNTDGSRGVITANTATTITATLDGGTDNDWDSSDTYTICCTDTGIGYRGGSRISLYSGMAGTGTPYEYVMGVESTQTWSTLNLP